MKGKFILVHGSASLSCPRERLDRASEFVRNIVSEILRREGGVVVLAGNEQETKDDDGNPHIFDWIVLREVSRYVESTVGPQRKCAYVVMSDAAWESKIEVANRQILTSLQQRDVIEVKRIRREEFTGGKYRAAQVQYADGMVALGGGKGTYACGKDMSDLGKPVLPMDLDIGAFSEDGKGALDLHREFVDSPGRFFPKTHATVAGRVEILSLHGERTEPSIIAQRAAEILQRELGSGMPLGLASIQKTGQLLWKWVQGFAKVAGIVRVLEVLKNFFS